MPLQIPQTVIDELKVFFPLLDKAGEFFKLSAAYCRLHICWFQVKTEVAVNIFVVISVRKGSMLPCEPPSAGIVLAARTPAIPAPVAHGQQDFFQGLVIGIDRSAFAHCHVMCRIKAGCSDVAEGPRGTGVWC